ncbi:MAG: sodium:proton antiporter NhaD [Saprospiraceae bacterium]|nr:sodium:proton antiporter NhaD [Saprospiraceae bacterium]
MLIPIILVFILGYAAIIFEHTIKINKTASALVTGIGCWTLYALSGAPIQTVEHQLIETFSNAAQILFFLLGAMALVEIIDAHDGFDVLIARIKTRKKVSLLWIIGLVSFFLSAVLDNLTTTIVMISFIRKLVNDREERLLLVGIIVISANAGGAWSPIGDVTTTMLWIGGQVTTGRLIQHVFLPSFACLIVPLVLVSRQFKGNLEPMEINIDPSVYRVETLTEKHKFIVFLLGIGGLIFVPIFKTWTHLPPFMGMLLSLGIVWIVTELMHAEKDEEEKDALSVKRALERTDTPSILFFVGILLAVGVLETTGILRGCAEFLSNSIGNQSVIAIIIGAISAIVDNVPLVAASMGMYETTQFPQDDVFWHFIAYCAGTGGSMLIIGSAAGVTAMGMEKIEFFWYLKRVGWLAAMGYFAGCAVFILTTFL